MEQLLTELAGIVSQLKLFAPEVWDIAMKQVVARAWSNTIGAIIALAICLVLVFFAIKNRKAWVSCDTSDNPFAAADFQVGTIIFGAFALCALLIVVEQGLEALKLFFNPQYYAIQILLGR